MELNNTSQYAIRILNYMNNNKDVQELFSARLLADELNINYKFLTTIMTKLVKAELLESIRGKDGGFKLLESAEKISLIRIIKLFDDSFESEACLLGIDKKCSREKKCFLHDKWKEPKRAVYELLEMTTLADLKNRGDKF